MPIRMSIKPKPCESFLAKNLTSLGIVMLFGFLSLSLAINSHQVLIRFCFRTHESEPTPFLYPFLPRLDSQCFDMPANSGFNSLCLHTESIKLPDYNTVQDPYLKQLGSNIRNAVSIKSNSGDSPLLWINLIALLYCTIAIPVLSIVYGINYGKYNQTILLLCIIGFT